jgi:AAA domain
VTTTFAPHQRLSILIHGASKLGKSTLTGTGPKPILVLDAEGSWRFIPLRQVYWDPAVGPPPEYDGTWDACVVTIDRWKTVELVYNWLRQYQTPFTTVVVDSITEIQRRCFVPDTELLTPTGWVKIDDVHDGDVVAQYEPSTEKISFVDVLDVQQFDHNGDVIRVETTFSDLAVTPDHRMLVKTDAGLVDDRHADELRVGLRLPVAGYASHAVDPNISDDDVRLIAAMQADSYHESRDVYSFNLRKKRKQERLLQLCESTGVKFGVLERADGWQTIRVYRNAAIDKWLDDKTFRWEMLTWPERLRRIFLEELAHWDGRRTTSGIDYSTTSDDNAEIVAAIASMTGYGVRTTTSKTRIGTTFYRMHLSDYTWRRVSQSSAISRERYVGPVNCVTVPSGYVVTRRNGKVTIAGNCKQNMVGTEAMKMADWGVLLNQMDNIIRGIRDLTLTPNINVRCVIFVAETRQNQDGKWVPYLQGQIAVSLPYWLDVVGYIYPDWEKDENGQPTEEVRRVWIAPHQQFEAGERVQGRLGSCQTISRPTVGTSGDDVERWMRTIFGITADVDSVTPTADAAVPTQPGKEPV